MLAHTLVLPVQSHEPPPHVSLPHSPSCRIHCRVHSLLPLRTSKPLMSPRGHSLCVGPSCMDAPTTATSRTITGAALTEKFVARTAWATPVMRSTLPPSPNA